MCQYVSINNRILSEVDRKQLQQKFLETRANTYQMTF